MGWQYNNDMNNLLMNWTIQHAGGPYGWTSSWGNGVQFNMNSIMDMAPWQAYNFQAINGMVNYGIPMNPFMMTPMMNAPSADSYVNMTMNQRRFAKAETALTTLDSTKENLEKMLTQEGVTEAQKTTIKEQIRKIEELQAKIEKMKPEMKTDKDWQKVYDDFEALMGEKTEIDTKIKELIAEVAKQNKADDDDAVDGADDGGDDGKVDGDSDSDSDTDVDGDSDPDVTAALSTKATTKEEATANLSTVYGENVPASVTAGDDGKLTREVTVIKDGKSVKETKTYDNIETLQAETKKLTATTKADAEENLKIVYGENIPEGMSAGDDGKIKVAFKDVVNGEITDRTGTADSIEAAENAMKSAKERIEAHNKAQADAQARTQFTADVDAVTQARLAFNKNVENISNTFADAVNGKDTIFGGTNDGKLKAAIKSLNADNIIEVMDHYYTSEKNKYKYNPIEDNSDDAEDFIEAFEDDADSSQQYELGNYIYNALLQRAIQLGIASAKAIPQLPQKDDGTYEDEFDRINGDDLGQYAVTSNIEIEGKNGNKINLAEQFNKLLAELNAKWMTSSSTVNESVRNIVKIIKAAEAQQ